MFKRLCAIVLLNLGFSGMSLAQFPGDVFFAQPSVIVGEGETAELELRAFMGAATFGAAHVEVVFDPNRLEVVASKPGTAEELQSGFVTERAPGKVGLVALNDTSLEGPIGTVSLARLQVRPLVGDGQRAVLNIVARELLNESSTPLANIGGFAGEVIVDSQSSASSKMGGQYNRQAMQKRAASMAWPGALVDIVPEYNNGGYGDELVSVRVAPVPSAESEGSGG